MWGAIVTALAAIMSSVVGGVNARKAENARSELGRRQFIASLKHQMAEEESPGAPGAYSYEAGKQSIANEMQRRAFEYQQDENKRQLFASILPSVVQAGGSAWSAGNKGAADSVPAAQPAVSASQPALNQPWWERTDTEGAWS